MKNPLSYAIVSKVSIFAKTHKTISVAIAIAVIGGGYWTYNTFASTVSEIRYVLGTVDRATIVASVSASGQVSASNQLDIQTKVSGEIISVNVTPGQKVAAGALIAVIDPASAQKAVRDAEVNLENAELSLLKLQKPASGLTLIQSENNLAEAQESKQNAEDDLEKAYDDGFNNVSNAFLNLPTVITGLQSVLYGTSANSSQSNIDLYADSIRTNNSAAEQANQFEKNAEDTYQAARKVYDTTFDAYKAASRFSDRAAIEALINQTYDTTKSVAEAVKSANNLIQLYQDELTKRNLTPAAFSNTALTNLGTYTGTTNTHLSSLLSAKNSIKTSKDNLVSADRTIAESNEDK